MIERSDEIWFPPMICENIFRFAFERAVDKRFLGTGRQAYMSARVLRFTFTNEEITELLSIGCVKLNVIHLSARASPRCNPVSRSSMATSLRGLGRSFQVKPFLLMRQNELTTPLTPSILIRGTAAISFQSCARYI